MQILLIFPQQFQMVCQDKSLPPGRKKLKSEGWAPPIVKGKISGQNAQGEEVGWRGTSGEWCVCVCVCVLGRIKRFGGQDIFISTNNC